MFSIAICDDEEYFRMREKQLILKYMENKACKCKIDMFHSGKELLKLKGSVSQYDMIFLDVNMEEIDGIETAKEIRKITKDAYIVFVTAFITYAPEGYKVDAVRYILKDDECLEKAVNECLETILQKMDYGEHKITFEFQEGKKEICPEDIVYIESNLHKLIFHMAGKDAAKYTMYARLDGMNELLRGAGFCRIHKSYTRRRPQPLPALLMWQSRERQTKVLPLPPIMEKKVEMFTSLYYNFSVTNREINSLLRRNDIWDCLTSIRKEIKTSSILLRLIQMRKSWNGLKKEISYRYT